MIIYYLVVQGKDIETHALKQLHGLASAKGGIERLPSTVLGDAFKIVDCAEPSVAQRLAVAELAAQTALDCSWVPATRRISDVAVAAFDMDSTLISIECIDEIADYAGVKAQVSAITESAMRGEINYPESLQQRVALLAGLSESVLENVYRERLTLNPGCEALMVALHAARIKLMVVSGGFTFFTSRIKERLGFHFAGANLLEVQDGKLTGRIASDIFDGEAKASAVREMAATLLVRRERIIAIGDGANDLPMMAEAGLSVAYHAKPAVRAAASDVLSNVGLDGVIALLG